MASFDHTSHPGGATQSLWQATVSVPDHANLATDITTDVCVVGAGIAGLSTAYKLLKAGKRVVVLDDGPIGGGETGRTTAHLTNAIDDRFVVLEKLFGEEKTRFLAESHTRAIHEIEAIVELEGIDCDFRRLDGFLFSATQAGVPELDDELAAVHRAGLSDVRKIERAPIDGFDSGPALRFPEQGQFHALKYIVGLAEVITSMGGEIYCGTHVAGVEGGSTCTVNTDRGVTVSASAVCVCTNSSISDFKKTHMKQAPYRTCVIGLSIPRGSATAALYWDTAHPYHYARLQPIPAAPMSNAHDTALSDVLIVGGEDFKTAHEDDLTERWERLEAWTRIRWPQAGPVMYKWSGQVLEPNDHVAYIGRNPDGAENIYMASGDSGQGMTHGMIAGILLTDLIVGRENPWTEIYDPRRITWAFEPMRELVKEAADVAVDAARGYLVHGGDTDDIEPGEGKVIRDGIHRIAAYRDDAGVLHECSAVCTHLKCVVGWNSAEKTWDCPCHGSRFDPYGEVINGPAIKPLEAVTQGSGVSADTPR